MGKTGIWSDLLSKAPGAGPRWRLLLWATIIALVFGFGEVGQPLEDLLRSGRNVLRSQKASGRIVVVGIDDRSLQKLGRWPWPRRYHAELAQRLHQMGARKILFDLKFSVPSDPVEDRIVANEFSRLGKQVTLPVQLDINPATKTPVETFPLDSLRYNVNLASISVPYNYRSAVWMLPYQYSIGDSSYVSYSSLLSGVSGPVNQFYHVDYSIDLNSIPYVSSIDIIDGAAKASLVSGKDVVIGQTAPQLGDTFFAVGYGLIPGVYLHVLGAETLQHGPTTELGWLLPAILAFIFVGVLLLAKNVKRVIFGVGGAILFFLVVPIALDQERIFTDVVPAIALLLFVGGRLFWVTFRQSYRTRGTVNAVSGLPNLTALRDADGDVRRPMVAARIQNFTEITSTLPPEREKILIEQIAGRLTLSAAGSSLYQGDEGVFVWFADEDQATVGDHLDALHSLFRSPVVVAGRQFDLSVTFGVDSSDDRSVANRLGSALVAADEAASEGLKWKEYDEATLEDTTWRLSLLSQLEAAIDTGDLWVAFQPKMDLATGQITGAEALARWTHPEKGPISPLEFIVAAEHSDRIEKLTHYVLEQGMIAAATINARGIAFNIAVNLSARLIDNLALVETTSGLLAKHDVPAHCLTLEVTETAALTSSGRNLEALEKLRAMGVHISIDDYGTGLSTLDYLKRIPANEIKIDQSFVRAIAKNHADRVMVNSTIQLAHSLGQTVVAEGVEDADTLAALVDLGCDSAQGYLIARPMELERLIVWLGSDKDGRITAHS